MLGLTLAVALIGSAPDVAAPSSVPEAAAEAVVEAPVAETVPAPAFETFTDDPLGVRLVVLDNGLTVMLSENHTRPEVFGAVVVRTGAKNDPPDDTGLAHYLEHMLFKGTRDLGTTDWKREQPLQKELEDLYERLRKADPKARADIQKRIGETVAKTYAYAVPNEIDLLLEDIGSHGVNAFTTYDETVYHNTFPATQIESWLTIYAHRFEDPVFRLFPTELEAVYEEKNIAIDTTGYELFRRFMRGAFEHHPYGTNDILGEVEHLKRPSLRTMRAYFRRWYVPSNMALVLSGDFDSAEVLPLIERTFGAWDPAPDPEARVQPVVPFRKAQRMKTRATPVRAGAIAFRTVPEAHEDYTALLVARRLLSNAQRSGAIDRLSDEGKLLYAVHVPADLADHNLDVVAYVPRLITQSFSGAEKLVLGSFRDLAAGRFARTTFDAIVQGLLEEQAARWENNRERALAMGHAFVTRVGWGGHLRHLQRLRELEPADVQRVATKLFGERYLAMRSRAGYPKKTRLAKPDYPAVTPRRGAHSPWFLAQRERPKPDPKLELVDPKTAVEEVSVRPGVVLRANGNPFNDLYQLELRFGVGLESKRELDLLDDYLARTGTAASPSSKLRERLFAIGTTLSARTELDRFVVQLDGPQEHLAAALDILAELMAEPALERKPLRKIRRERWAFRHYDRKNPPTVGQALRDHVLYGPRSPRRREYGPVGAPSVGARKLLSAWQRVQDYELEIGYVGKQDPEKVAELVREHLPLRVAKNPRVPHVVLARQVPAETTVYFVPQRGAVQTQLWFAVEGEPVDAKTRAAAIAFDEYFGGGMAGLVFQEIREFRALAYAANAHYLRDENPLQRGYLLAHVGCQADKTFEAIDVMLGLLTDLPRAEDRMDLVRSALLHAQETEMPSFRELQDRLDTWRHVGYTEDPRRAATKAIAALEFDDLVELHRRHLAGKPLAIMVVADPRKVKPATLRKYGKLVRLREGRLYSP